MMRRNPINYNPPFKSPVRDWMILLAHDWGDNLDRNVYGQVMSIAWLRLKEQGLCGKVTPDGSDVWDVGNLTRSDH